MPYFHYDPDAAVLRGPGPYTARPAKDDTPDWAAWYVTNNGRTNILSFPGCGGAVLTSREVAEEIARRGNAGTNIDGKKQGMSVDRATMCEKCGLPIAVCNAIAISRIQAREDQRAEMEGGVTMDRLPDWIVVGCTFRSEASPHREMWAVYHVRGIVDDLAVCKRWDKHWQSWRYECLSPNWFYAGRQHLHVLKYSDIPEQTQRTSPNTPPDTSPNDP